jgi:hypothetical protein
MSYELTTIETQEQLEEYQYFIEELNKFKLTSPNDPILINLSNEIMVYIKEWNNRK